MTKKGIIYCLLSITLLVYLLFAVNISDNIAAAAVCTDVKINVADNALSQFVTSDNVDKELGYASRKYPGQPIAKISTKDIEDKLNALSTIEKANCYRTADNNIVIDVVPMEPVARVFDPGNSYYINRSGKHLMASTRYKLDVPIVIRETTSAQGAETLTGMLDSIAANDAWNELVSALKIERNGDVTIVPTLSGHIINFGSPDNIDDKFGRLFEFYRRVMPVKGWNYYDTISVKYAGQIVGKIHPGSLVRKENEFKDEDYTEEIDLGTIAPDSTNVARELNPKIQ